MDTEILVNRHLSAERLDKIKSHGSDSAPVIFALVGELNAEGHYAESTIAFTSEELIVFDLDTTEEDVRVRYSEITDIFAKRMYGNAFIRVRREGESRPQNVFRYTLGIAALCDAAILFVKNIKAGESVESQKDSISAAYEKQLSVCPRCGRTLSSPGVKCINCEDKGKIIARLAVYLKPELPEIIISIILSVFTTGLMLVPPYLTKTLVDSVLVRDANGNFPENAMRMLITIGMLLAGIQIVRYTCAAFRASKLKPSGRIPIITSWSGTLVTSKTASSPMYTLPPFTEPLNTLIGGVPRNFATNRFCGLS